MKKEEPLFLGSGCISFYVVLAAAILVLVLTHYMKNNDPVTHEWYGTYCLESTCVQENGEIHEGQNVECPQEYTDHKYVMAWPVLVARDTKYFLEPNSCVIKPK